MKHNNPLILMALCGLMATGCGHKTDSPQPITVTFGGFTDTVTLEVESDEPTTSRESSEEYFDRKVREASEQATAPRTSAPKAKKVTTETIYVETDGAQGRVWGHVTMRGDRGSGTIHDWDENTLTVSVTRHGDELFAVDQNSRQYVFKLKK